MPPLAPPQRSFLRALLTLDATLSQNIHTLTTLLHLPRALLVTLELLADFRLFLPVTLALLAASPPNLHRPFGTSLIAGLLIDLLLIAAVKLIFRRQRPIYNKHMTAAVSADHYSFPSGHASRVFFVAAFVAVSIREGQLGDFGEVERWIWAWAGVTAGSRILLGRHYVFDVVVGMLLGVIEGLFVFRFVKF